MKENIDTAQVAKRVGVFRLYSVVTAQREGKRRNMKSKKKLIIKKNNYTRKQKAVIADKVFHLTEKDALDDFNKLKQIGCDYHTELSQTGNKAVNNYTLVERLNTIGTKKINFYDFWKNKASFKKKPFVKNMVDFYNKRAIPPTEGKMLFRIFNLYYTPISIFNPLIAMDVYCRFKPTCILDFTMGWGGRLVGACALNIPKYIGIDYNKNLEVTYNKMSRFLKKHSTTDIQLYFQNALTIDYSKLDYDLVLTSPPYYNIETYGGNEQMSKDKWNTEFYIPIFQETYKHLKKGGHYCINIPGEVYKNVAVKILGKCTTKIPLPKAKRTAAEKYQEFIYVWKK